MKLKNFKISLLFITAVILTFGLSVSFQSLLAAWTAPLANPATCLTGDPGCDAPLNSGPFIQTKIGALWINTGGLSPYGLIVEKGNVGIGITPLASPTYRLDVNGSIRATEFIYNSSDRRLKDDIRIIPNALGKVLQLEGVQYKLIKTGEKGIGLIAQDVEKVFPELASTDADGYKSLQYGNLVAPLIEAMKEQQAQIEKLKERIEELEKSREQ